MKRKIACLLLILILIALSGCGEKPTTGPCGLPKLESFSGEQYEEYALVFPPVVSVTYRYGGQETEIAADDPRVVRLLNFIAYSWERELTHYRHGYVENDEFLQILNKDIPMLKIVFDNEPFQSEEDGVANVPEILILEYTFLLYPYHDYENSPEESWAEEYYPYGALIVDAYMEGRVDSIEQGFNILEYTGFIEK